MSPWSCRSLFVDQEVTVVMVILLVTIITELIDEVIDYCCLIQSNHLCPLSDAHSFSMAVSEIPDSSHSVLHRERSVPPSERPVEITPPSV